MPAILSTTQGILYNFNNETYTDDTVDLTTYLPFQTISSSCFSNANLGKVYFPSSLTTIQTSAFANSKLSTITLQEGSLLQEIGLNAFSNCGLTSLDFTGTQLTHIQSNAFQTNSNLGSVLFPSKISTVGYKSFAECLALSTISFPNTVANGFSIESNAFQNDSNLKTVRFPNDMNQIQSETFFNCTSLSNVFFDKNGLANGSSDRIGIRAFANTDLGSLTLPDDISLSTNCLSSCLNLLSLNVTTNFKNFSTFTQENVGLSSTTIYTLGSNAHSKEGCEYNVANFLTNPPTNPSTFRTVVRSTQKPLTLSTLDISFLLKNSINGLSTNVALQTIGCIDGSSVSINDFSLNAGQVTYLPLLENESITIAGLSTYNISVTGPTTFSLSATQGSFSNSYSLSDTFTLDSTPYQFVGTGSLFFKNLLETEIWQVVNGVFSFINNTRYQFNTFDLLSVNNTSNFSKLADECFGGNFNGAYTSWPNLGTITLPTNVSSLGSYAFGGCANLSTLLFQNGDTNLTTIGDGVFGETRLQNFNISSMSNLISIGKYGFTSTLLNRIDLPSTITDIGEGAFLSCGSLSTILFQSNSQLTYIPTAFCSKAPIQSISIPDNIETISSSAFMFCPSLQNVQFTTNSKLSTIDNCAFSDFNILPISLGNPDSNLLPSIFLPNSLSKLGENVFSTCFNMHHMIVTSSFDHFNIFTRGNVGLPSTILSSIYTLGLNTNSKDGCDYPVVNLYANPPTDPNEFRNLIRGLSEPLLIMNYNASGLFSFGSAPAGINLNNITINAIPCVDGSIIDISWLSTDKNVLNYFSMIAGETIYIRSNNYITTFIQKITVKDFAYIQNSVSQDKAIDTGISFTVAFNENNTAFYNFCLAGTAGAFAVDAPTPAPTPTPAPAPTPAPRPQPCLIEGTLVLTPTGYKPIETIQVGDSIISHCKLTKKVLKVGRWVCDYKNRTLEQTVYKIPSKKYGATKDVYLSHYHKVSDGTNMLYPKTLGLEVAKESEYVTNGKFTLYHLQVEKSLLNHLVVNGNCIVDSWVIQ